MSQQTFKADVTDIGKRIDVFVAEREGITRSASQKVLADGGITVNGRPIKKNYKILENDVVEVELGDTYEIIPNLTPADSNEDYIVYYNWFV